MSLSEKINKIKIVLFGNIWITRVVKLFLYSSVILVAWAISKSENLFPGENIGPWAVFKNTLRWEDKLMEHWLSGFFALSFFILLIFAYFWILSIFVGWLTKIEISPQQQIKIIEKKTYELGEKLSYKVEKINNLETTVFRGSPYVSLTGNLLLSDGKQKKTIDFVCRSHSSVINPYLSPSSLETHLPQTKLEFKQKFFFTWQKIIGIIVLAAGVGFIRQIRKDGETYKDQKLGPIVKSKGAIQAELTRESEKKNAEEKRQKELKEAKITDPKDIKRGFKSIGGLGEFKKQCENNAKAIKERHDNPKSLNSPKHMLLYGPPGTGKTFLAQAIAKASGSFFLDLNGKDFAISWAQQIGNEKGMSAEDKIRRTFDIALQFSEGKPVVALIDEIDQMGERWDAGKELLSVTSGATSERYKNIIIIATTNEIRKLSGALLRSERLGRKMLINYPGPKDLREIVHRVAEAFYDEVYPRKGGPEALGSRSKTAFTNEFGKLVREEIGKDNYAVKLEEIFYDIKREEFPEKMDPDEKKTLFTGADVKAIFFESLNVMDEWGHKILNKEHVKEATKRIYEDNLANPDWIGYANRFLREEYINKLDQEDKRKIAAGRRKPQGPRQD